jgi:hypothetical protein
MVIIALHFFADILSLIMNLDTDDKKDDENVDKKDDEKWAESLI